MFILDHAQCFLSATCLQTAVTLLFQVKDKNLADIRFVIDNQNRSVFHFHTSNHHKSCANIPTKPITNQ